MSSVTLNLRPQENRNPCKLRITAPKTHAINTQLINNIELNKHSTEIKNNQEQCLLSVVSTKYLISNSKTE